MFSLRGLFFIVKDMADYFELVKYGICAILCFVGMEMILSKWVEVPLGYMCVIICALFVSSILLSIIKVIFFDNSIEQHDQCEQKSSLESDDKGERLGDNSGHPKRRPEST